MALSPSTEADESEVEMDEDEDQPVPSTAVSEAIALANAPDEEEEVDPEEIDTLGGLVFMLSGRVPARGEVVVHPESLVHALVGFNDGALMAHVGPPDMRHAIGHALHWPDRRANPVERLDLAAIGALTFRAADETRWPALRLAREVMTTRGGAGAVFNAAKETALDGFIAEQIGFPEMANVVETVLDNLYESYCADAPLGLERVMMLDDLARQEARRIIAKT